MSSGSSSEVSSRSHSGKGVRVRRRRRSTRERKTSTLGTLVRIALVLVAGIALIVGVFVVYPLLFSLADGQPEPSTQKAVDRITPSPANPPIQR